MNNTTDKICEEKHKSISNHLIKHDREIEKAQERIIALEKGEAKTNEKVLNLVSSISELVDSNKFLSRTLILTLIGMVLNMIYMYLGS